MRKVERESIYQLWVSLTDSEPVIWRKVLVDSSFTFADLHVVMQILMDWTDSHLHEFVVGKTHLAHPETIAEDLTDSNAEDSSMFAIRDMVKRAGTRFTYVYDYGDMWVHDVVLEKILPVDPEQIYPVCIGGGRAAPPEDCGGIGGYENLVKILANPKHEEHKEMLDWVGGAWDADRFDLKVINTSLARLGMSVRAVRRAP
ncbi:MAG: plasmid pRiA4b ORF-3 family protein [Euryarchaeota archaeon]|nr:plasmid pRiA4b ORF-3 family protein [Euryarchaeota archaeon]